MSRELFDEMEIDSEIKAVVRKCYEFIINKTIKIYKKNPWESLI